MHMSFMLATVCLSVLPMQFGEGSGMYHTKAAGVKLDPDFDSTVLIRGGNPVIAKSATVADAQGDAYYLTVDSRRR